MTELRRSIAVLTLAAVALPGASALAQNAAPTPASAPSSPAAPPSPEQAPPPTEPPSEKPTEVFVGGTRVTQTSGSAHVMTAKQLERFEHDDPHQVLMAVPGVYVRPEDGFGLRPNIGMRGAISDRSKKITLMEDGVLFGPAPYSAPAAYYFPMITRMQTVRVVKGPSAILYGPHTVAGAIDLVTAPVPESNQTFLDLAFGQYLSRKVHLRTAVVGDDVGLLVEGVHVGSEGFKVLDGGGSTGFSRTEVMAKGRWRFGSEAFLRHELELKGGYSHEISNETYLGLTDADFRATPYRRYAASRLDRMEWHRTQLVLTHKMSRGQDLDLTTTLYRHDLVRSWNKVNAFRGTSLFGVLTDPSAAGNARYLEVLRGDAPRATDGETLLVGPNDRRFESMGLQTVLRYRPVTWKIAHKIELGARVHADSIRRDHSEQGFDITQEGPVSLGEPTEITSANSASTLALAGHVVDAATLGPVTLTAGARVEAIRGEYTDDLTGRRDVLWQQVLLPGAGVFVALPQSFGLLAGVYQGFSPVPPGQREAVRPEKSVNYEWGARWSPRRFRVEVIGFFNDYQNLVNICTFSGGCTDTDADQQTDGGKAVVGGLEAFVESELEVAKGWAVPGRLAYTFTHARFANDFSSNDPIFGDVKAGDVVPYLPEHQLTASVGVEHERFAVNVGGTFVDAMREKAGSGTPDPRYLTDAYFLLDASASGRITKWLEVYATGKNLTDTAYIASRRPFGARPGAPVWLQLGLKLRL